MLVKTIEEINKENALPEFILGSAGRLEFDFIQAKKSEVKKDIELRSVQIHDEYDEEWIAIICHPHPVYGGSMDNKVVHTLCRAWRDQGVCCLRFNFRGVGKSEGVFDNGHGEYLDLSSIFDFVKTRFGQDKKIILAGFSFGAYIAAKYASINHVNALVLVAPPVQYIDFVKSNVFTSHTLIVQGDADEVVNVDSVTNWFNQDRYELSSVVELKILKDASHFFHGRLTELKTLVENFYNSL